MTRQDRHDVRPTGFVAGEDILAGALLGTDPDTGHLVMVGHIAGNPRVVIDPETSHYAIDRLAALLDRSPARVRTALRDLTTPAKPEEPTGLGAVVVGGEGRVWIHHGHGRWVRDDGMLLDWGRLTVLRVLSKGVQTDG